MKQGVQKLWAELGKAQKPAKFSKQGKEVKLSKVDDAERLYEELRDAYSEASYFIDEVLPDLEDKMSEIYSTVDEYFINGQMRYMEEASSNLIEVLSEIENSAKALGIDTDEIYPDFDEAFDLTNAADGYGSEAKREWESSRVSRASNFDIPL